MNNEIIFNKLCDIGKTEYWLAKQLEIAPEAVYQWRKGLTKPCKKNRVKIAKVFNLSVKELEYELHRETTKVYNI